MVIIFRSARRERCLELRLALDAAGIRSKVIRSEGHWLLVVSPADESLAREELGAYADEIAQPPPPAAPALPTLPGGELGVVAFVAVLLAVEVSAGASRYGVDWIQAGAMRAGLVMGGEWWRVFTALTLHVDGAHLVANLFFGSVFGFFAAQALGGGVAWLGILIAGGVGNALNAAARSPEHSAIGASTAVFATLGILVAHGLHHRRRLPLRARRWSPLIGGLLLLAYTGTGGGRTDVLAHVTGFLAGLVLGGLASLLSREWLRARGVQWVAAFCGLLILLASWRLALMSSG